MMKTDVTEGHKVLNKRKDTNGKSNNVTIWTFSRLVYKFRVNPIRISTFSGDVVTEFHRMILKFSWEDKWAIIIKKCLKEWWCNI